MQQVVRRECSITLFLPNRAYNASGPLIRPFFLLVGNSGSNHVEIAVESVDIDITRSMQVLAQFSPRENVAVVKLL